MLDPCHVHCVRHKLTPRRHFPLSLSDNEIVSEIMESRVTPLSACDREFTHRALCHSDARPSIFKQPHHPHGLNTNEATSHVFMLLANTTKNYGDYYQSDKWHLHIKIQSYICIRLFLWLIL